MKQVRRERVNQATGRVTTRTTTVRKCLFAANRGFVIVNDAPAMASQLARYLSGRAVGFASVEATTSASLDAALARRPSGWRR